MNKCQHCLVALSTFPDDMKPIDLTLVITPKTPMFPGSPAPQFIQWNAIERDGYNLEIAVLSTHTGTHLDAPYHFCRLGARLHQIPVDRLMRRATLIRTDSNQISRKDLVRFEDMHGIEYTYDAVIQMLINRGHSKDSFER